MPLMKTQDLNTKIITKKPKNARNCESRASWGPMSQIAIDEVWSVLRFRPAEDVKKQ
jgi:hypothetical protein